MVRPEPKTESQGEVKPAHRLFAAVSAALWRKRVWLLIGGLLLAAVTIAVAVLNAPSIGTIQNTGTSTVPPPATTPASRTLTGKYIQFKYPSAFVAIESNTVKPPPGLLAYHILTAPASGPYQSTQLAVSVRELPAGGLADDSNYRHYNGTAEHFDKQTVAYGSDQVTVFRAQDEAYSAILFWPHGKLLAIVALTSSLGDPDELDKALSQVQQTFTWR